MRYTETSFEALGLGDCLPNAAVRQQAPKGAGGSGVYPRAKQSAAAEHQLGTVRNLRSKIRKDTLLKQRQAGIS